VGQLFGFEQASDPALKRGVDGNVGARAGNLHGGIFAEQVGQREGQGPEQRQADQ